MNMQRLYLSEFRYRFDTVFFIAHINANHYSNLVLL